MKKIAYSAAPAGEEPQTVGPSADLVDKMTSTETGGRGIGLVEMTSEFDATDPTGYTESDDKLDKSEDDGLLDLLVMLGDEMDKEGEESFANFTDFLLEKYAEAKSIDYTNLYNLLMIKVNNADIVNTNEVLKKLTKIYSRTLLLEYMKQNDIEQAKESAYKKALHRADQYLSEG